MDALAQLSPKHREVLELTCYHGFTCEEAGQILDVPVGTVKSRLNHARKAVGHIRFQAQFDAAAREVHHDA